MKSFKHAGQERKWLSFPVLGVLIASGLLSACTNLPASPAKTASTHMPAAQEGLLAQAGSAVLNGRTEADSAFLMIPENDAALQWRLALIDSAVQSIDLQVFIWSDDECGRLMLDHILKAVERDVRVRLLIDDVGWDWPDEWTAMLDRMDGLEVRRFNPGRRRNSNVGRGYDFTVNLKKLNRRMHNKQMVVDGRWAVFGGRNIGNPYFGLSKKYNFHDLDVLMAGPAIDDLATGFDAYWNSEAAYPGEAMSGELSEKKVAKNWKRFHAVVEKDRELLQKTPFAVEPKDWSASFEKLSSAMVFGSAKYLRDEPVVEGDRGTRLEDQIRQEAPDWQTVARVISPYFIPSREHIDAIHASVHKKGRTMKLLVPSMESINHTHIHSHYKKYRKDLLRAGAELYELSGYPSEKLRLICDTPPVKAPFISLHVKGATYDDRWTVVGSLNLDPRALKINTEHILLIDSPELSVQFRKHYDWIADTSNAWNVSFTEKEKLRWTMADETVTRQPARSLGQRCLDSLYRTFPLEKTLNRIE